MASKKKGRHLSAAGKRKVRAATEKALSNRKVKGRSAGKGQAERARRKLGNRADRVSRAVKAAGG